MPKSVSKSPKRSIRKSPRRSTKKTRKSPKRSTSSKKTCKSPKRKSSVKKRAGKYHLGVQNLAGDVQDINGFIKGNIDATISDLKQHILDTQNIPVQKQRLIKATDNGHELLDDSRKISSYGFNDDDTIHMFVANVHGAFIRKFGKSGRGDGQFISPEGICVSNGEIYVADTGNNRIQVFDLHGNFSRKFGAQSDYPSGICVSNGEIYVSNAGLISGHGNHCIQVFDLDGNLIRMFGRQGQEDGQFYTPKGIYVSNDEIYVADTGNKRVQVFNLEGNFIRKIETGHIRGGIHVSNGQVYVVNIRHFIEVFDLQGKFIRKIGKWGSKDGDLNLPTYITVSNDEIYVSDTGNRRVQVFNLQGKFIRKFGNGVTQGICVSNGEVYVVSDYDVQVYEE